MPKTDLQEKRTAILQRVLEHVERNAPLLVLKAPPGSGKTYVSTHAVALAAARGRRIAIATQTNAQADDFCRRMAQGFKSIAVHRWASSSRMEQPLGASVSWIVTGKELPVGPCVVVATSAKWSASKLEDHDPFDLLLIDEAWQMSWADFMLMSAVSSRFVLVGDPGQIPPVVPIDVSRWQTSRRPPHVPAPEVILRDCTLPTNALELPVTTRLPHDTCEFVRSFYDFHFDSWAAPGERSLSLTKPAAVGDGVDSVLSLLTTGSVALLTLPTPEGGPPLEEDLEVARAVVDVIRRLLSRETVCASEEEAASPLRPSDIGVAATHRVMNTRIMDELGELASEVRVDTPERWQGLERKVMVVIHPLSGVVSPSAFDLSTGRLCVMASRHNTGLVIVSRDHVAQTLSDYLPVADQAVGLRDEAGRGRAQNLAVWRYLEANGRVASLA